ncbi:hypothetical protein CGRA01v4_14142 [Colletotrichum graminicola]|uniref:Uncharacterized protein n=1 Tax=Colletotrichum graminicola (strain M1.001 / M2 / FGSC 10212) TaxID=645133 RepID=E3R038_COLGM|nr:uncharacterized protein GLRG_11621 [Colletotrichum graminicola M1.001]EFQ36476.1 hypothetical protein GLRG_11621 [Colletotrichum graminicola M1.001]WDK22851.1 hypothetical protein CGRA01v4_14142 [Colletotrichum graminicola]
MHRQLAKHRATTANCQKVTACLSPFRKPSCSRLTARCPDCPTRASKRHRLRLSRRQIRIPHSALCQATSRRLAVVFNQLVASGVITSFHDPDHVWRTTWAPFTARWLLDTWPPLLATLRPNPNPVLGLALDLLPFTNRPSLTEPRPTFPPSMSPSSATHLPSPASTAAARHPASA